MGQDWPKGDEPACGDVVEMWIERAAILFLVIVALFVVAA